MLLRLFGLRRARCFCLANPSVLYLIDFDLSSDFVRVFGSVVFDFDSLLPLDDDDEESSIPIDLKRMSTDLLRTCFSFGLDGAGLSCFLALTLWLSLFDC